MKFDKVPSLRPLDKLVIAADTRSMTEESTPETGASQASAGDADALSPKKLAIIALVSLLAGLLVGGIFIAVRVASNGSSLSSPVGGISEEVTKNVLGDNATIEKVGGNEVRATDTEPITTSYTAEIAFNQTLDSLRKYLNDGNYKVFGVTSRSEMVGEDVSVNPCQIPDPKDPNSVSCFAYVSAATPNGDLFSVSLETRQTPGTATSGGNVVTVLDFRSDGTAPVITAPVQSPAPESEKPSPSSTPSGTGSASATVS